MKSPRSLDEIRQELRSPINHILGYCEVLLEEEQLPEITANDLRKIHRSARQLLELVSRHLDPSEFQAPKDWRSVRHDLRTPINQILGYAEILLEQAEDQPAGLGQQTLPAILVHIRSAAQQWVGLMERHLSQIPTDLDKASGIPDKDGEDRPTEDGESRAELPAETGWDALVGALLVVDDDQPSRELLARRLRRLGFDVTTAADGRETLDWVDQRPFDLILMDWTMPGMDGLELLQRIRKKRSRNQLPVIMVTGRDAGADVARALDAGANDYLTKPVDFQAAMARVRTQLELKETHAELDRQMTETRRLADELGLRNQFIKRVFGRYVSDQVVHSLLEDPKGLELGGQKRIVTILMCDLRGFSALAEKLDPERVVELLNVYLGAMADIILKYQGTIDEFIGDAILAVFGAPLLCPNHADFAVACSLEMQLEMAQVNRQLERLGIPPLEMGIGVNTGEVVTGNIGSVQRAKYGVIGSQVNLAGRIQSTSVGGEVLVSESTFLALGGHLRTDRSFVIWPKGASSFVRLWSAVGLIGRIHLDLPSSDLSRGGLARQYAVNGSLLLESKIVSGNGFTAQLKVMSQQSGILETDEPLSARCDLKLVIDSGVKDVRESVYCKVMEDRPGQFGWEVRFTSALPDAMIPT
jgi:adenylate cyclase